jgi:hypothetical protein
MCIMLSQFMPEVIALNYTVRTLIGRSYYDDFFFGCAAFMFINKRYYDVYH